MGRWMVAALVLVEALALGCGRKATDKAAVVADDDAADDAAGGSLRAAASDAALGERGVERDAGNAPPQSAALPGVPAQGDPLLRPVPAAYAGAFELVKLVSGLDRPVAALHAPGDPVDRLFVVEQSGRLRLVEGGRVLPDAVLDLRAVVSTGNEQGLLGLAFHPGYASNARLYVNYTDRRGTTHVDEYTVQDRARPRIAPETARPILEIKQPYANHNGGHLAFGPDGKLYVGTGDGGAAGDPKGNGQNPKALLGKMLRLDVDRDATSAEILHRGLRNPWRYAFDPKTGDLFIADVGQNKWESVHWVAGADAAPKNFGWNIVEGSHCFSSAACDRAPFSPPIAEYDHGQGCSITGGVVYRGPSIPALAGAFLYSDFCSGFLRSVRVSGGIVHDHWDWAAALPAGKSLGNVASFGVDGRGEVLVVGLDGTIWQLRARP